MQSMLFLCSFSDVALEDFQREGACLRFTLMDYNFVVKNDFGGEAYFPLSEVPYSESHSRQSSVKRTITELAFMKPHNTRGKKMEVL